jgi:hypothetical protein
MKEASYTMEKVNDEYKLKEVVDGVAQFVGDSISSIAQGTIIGRWYNPIEINNINIEKNHLPFWGKKILGSHPKLQKVDSVINYLDEGTDFSGLFYKAENLTYIREIKSSKVSNFYQTFYGCEKLEEIPELNFAISSISTMNFIETFKKCYRLKEVRIKNLNGNSFRESPMELNFSDCLELSNESINNIINNISKHTSNDNPYILVFNNNKKNYFVNTYCKILDKENDYLPMKIVSNSTNAAITLENYITIEKGITLQFNEVNSQ